MGLEQLTLEDLRVGLTDLLEERRAALRQLSHGELYGQLLKDQLAELLAAIASAGGPVVDDLALIDARHDALGRAIWFTTAAYVENPLVTPELRMLAARVRQEIIPSLDELRQSYADEAAHALARRQRLRPLEDDLRRFPVADGGTLLHWVEAFLREGEALSRLLHEHAGRAAPRMDPAARLRVRMQVIGHLQHLRAAARAERRPDLDLDEALFAHFDQLAARHDAA
jgi:hypothetical protein